MLATFCVVCQTIPRMHVVLRWLSGISVSPWRDSQRQLVCSWCCIVWLYIWVCMLLSVCPYNLGESRMTWSARRLASFPGPARSSLAVLSKFRTASDERAQGVRARCRAKGKSRITSYALFCACVHWYGTCTTFARYTLAELCAQSPEVPRGVMVRA